MALALTKRESAFITRAFGHIENEVPFSGTPAAPVPPLEHGFPDECVNGIQMLNAIQKRKPEYLLRGEKHIKLLYLSLGCS